MQLTINGQKKNYPDDLTVAQLLTQLNFSAETIVVELNRNILTPAAHASTRLNPGDTIELVQFVGGG